MNLPEYIEYQDIPSARNRNAATPSLRLNPRRNTAQKSAGISMAADTIYSHEAGRT